MYLQDKNNLLRECVEINLRELMDLNKAARLEQTELNNSLKKLISKIDIVFNLTLKVSQKNERIQRIFNERLIRALKQDISEFDD